MLEQLLGAVGMVEDLGQVVYPGDVDVGARLAFLIGPVRGKPALGLFVQAGLQDLSRPTLLEVGCGAGGNLLELLRLGFPESASPELLERVNERTAALAQEIAERTNIPLGTVKSRIRLAFNKLRGLLTDD